MAKVKQGPVRAASPGTRKAPAQAEIAAGGAPEEARLIAADLVETFLGTEIGARAAVEARGVTGRPETAEAVGQWIGRLYASTLETLLPGGRTPKA